MKEPLLGKGIYSIGETSRLTGVPAQTIRRWVKGYDFKTGSSPPVWTKDIPDIGHTSALSFLDLMEVRFVNVFRVRGVSWPTIREAARRAAKLFNNNHPFSTKRFLTDGRSIFAELISETGERHLLDIVKNQYAFRQVISREFRKGLEFSTDGHLLRWWPLGQNKAVVIDPERSFGHPIIAKEGVRTSVLAQAYNAEGSVITVAKWFEVDRKAVENAIAYEKKLAQGLKAA